MKGVWLLFTIVSYGVVSYGYAQITTICINGYTLRPPANEYCYKYYQIDEDYSAANRSCVRDGASLVFINSSEENAYLRDNFFDPNGQTEFWIGLNDLDVEGVFMWAVSSGNMTPSYLNWAVNFPVDNSINHDCVKFAADGWRVHSGFCSTSTLPHVCKMRSCSSLDGRFCMGSEPTTESTVPVVAIVVPIVVVIVIILLIAVVLILLGLWKFNNDAFQRYCCCCLRGSKSAIHSMQQENQRLRHEISQHKISMSGRYQPGQLGSGSGENELMSGVPDGRGGVLPPIKRQFPSNRLSPMTDENRVLGFATTPLDNAPPPLVAQRPSQVSPMRQSSGSFSFGYTPSRPLRQSLPANIGIPARPSVPAPIRGGTVRTPRVTEEPEKKGDTKDSEEESESAESDKEN